MVTDKSSGDDLKVHPRPQELIEEWMEMHDFWSPEDPIVNIYDEEDPERRKDIKEQDPGEIFADIVGWYDAEYGIVTIIRDDGHHETGLPAMIHEDYLVVVRGGQPHGIDGEGIVTSGF